MKFPLPKTKVPVIMSLIFGCLLIVPCFFTATVLTGLLGGFGAGMLAWACTCLILWYDAKRRTPPQEVDHRDLVSIQETKVSTSQVEKRTIEWDALIGILRNPYGRLFIQARVGTQFFTIRYVCATSGQLDMYVRENEGKIVVPYQKSMNIQGDGSVIMHTHGSFVLVDIAIWMDPVEIIHLAEVYSHSRKDNLS